MDFWVFFMVLTNRYKKMQYRNCGKSGLKLPIISLGLWHNFGTNSNLEDNKKLITTAFDNGITHFDLANNYGPKAGSAECNFGKILKDNLSSYRDEIIVSTKAGYYMWEGPYGEFGSKKYLIASLDQSLKRLGLDYVDIFYHHRPSEETPIEEIAHTLDLIVRQGKALYVGISNYPPDKTREIYNELKRLNTPFIIHQPRYNMLERWSEDELTSVLDDIGLGCIAFSPLAQGILTNRYSKGIPSDSRVRTSHFLNEERIKDFSDIVMALDRIALERGQTMAQLAISWILNNNTITSVLIGASRISQLEENLSAIDNLSFTNEELEKIDMVLSSKDNLKLFP